MMPTDPYTPLLRVYQNDKVQIRTLVGAHTNVHSFHVHGMNWLSEPQSPNSGYRSAQGMGLSEHFEMLFTVPTVNVAPNAFADYLYNASLGTSGLSNPIWGIMRAYDGSKGPLPDLKPLPSNPKGGGPMPAQAVCPKPDRQLVVVASSVCRLLGGSAACDPQNWGKSATALVYNSRGQATKPGTFDPTKVIQDPNALVFVEASQVDEATGQLKASGVLGPLVLRAAAGECVDLTLKNGFQPTTYPFQAQYGASVAANLGPNLPNITLQTSTQAGLQPQAVSYSVTEGLGMNVGFNVDRTVAPDGGSRTMRFYAGRVSLRPDGTMERTPVEFGTLNLMSSDPLLHHSKGMIGALIIEPEGSSWKPDAPGADSTSATVTKDGATLFREFVTLFQADAETCSSAQGKYSCITQWALNYRTEPQSYRYPSPNNGDFSDFLSNTLVNGDPQTRVFVAPAGTPVRIRVLYPSGGGGAKVFAVHGHGWPDRPFVAGSTRIDLNPLSQYTGSQQMVPNETFQAVLPSAGGSFCVQGDYLIHLFANESPGAWGILRVGPPDSTSPNSCPK
jgi:hypothetical protein